MPTTSTGIPFLRTPDESFQDLPNFNYEPHYLDIDGLRLHYIDEGPRDAPVALLMHGMPTWSFLYRHMIPSLLAAGYRCIAPDHIGFGRSDKVTDESGYNIARHTDKLTACITSLNLHNITIFVQDWGGPIGLAQVRRMPERFSRLVIMNTWLHHASYEYSPGAKQWISQWVPGGLFEVNIPDNLSFGELMTFATGHENAGDVLRAALTHEHMTYSGESLNVKNGYSAPFAGLGREAIAGPRRFPMSIPLHDPVAGNAVEQEKDFEFINATSLPVHFVWGGADGVFVAAWGKKWHSLIPHSTFDLLPDAMHFLQDTHGPEIVAIVLNHINHSLKEIQ